jgi:hypothetical protein
MMISPAASAQSRRLRPGQQIPVVANRGLVAGGSAIGCWTSSILPSIVDAAEHDPEFAGIHSTIQHGHAAPLRAALDRAAIRGQIPPAADRNAIAAALLGPLFYRRWFSREQIDTEFVEMIIRSAIAGLHPDPRNPKREQAAK